MNCCLLNMRSIVNKTESILDLMSEKHINVAFLTETWLRKNDPASKLAINTILGSHNIIHADRPSRLGGGVAVVLSRDVSFKYVDITVSVCFEFLCGWLRPSGVLMLLLYRPPSNSKEKFLKDLDGFLSEVSIHSNRIIIAGDINLHLEKTEDPHVKQFYKVCVDHQLTPQVPLIPTHCSGHTLDMVLASFDVSNISVFDNAVSDHLCVLFKVPKLPVCKQNTHSPKQNTFETYQYRDWKSVNKDEFRRDFERMTSVDMCLDAHKLFQVFDQLLEKHAPGKQRTKRATSRKYRYSHRIAEQKRKRRQLERQYSKTKLTVHKQLLVDQRRKIQAMVKDEKAVYYRHLIDDSLCSSRTLFNVVDRILSTSDTNNMPLISTTVQELCNDFGLFFVSKVANIVNSFDSPLEGNVTMPSSPSITTSTTSSPSITTIMPSSPSITTNTLGCPSPVTSHCAVFDSFVAISVHATSKLRRLKINQTVDILPLTLMNYIIDSAMPVFTDIINDSFTKGSFPSNLKKAIITPILKSAQLDPEKLSSYRPVSNLTFVSKLIETAACNQLVSHINFNRLWHPNQSAYRKYHSVETALLSVSSSVLERLDDHHNVLFVMLDLSAAFDTVNHQILIDTLFTKFRVEGMALKWLKSYLSGRTFSVKCGNTIGSGVYRLDTGVPQGSVLGPVLFNCYITELFSGLEALDVCFHSYADDVQIWCSYNPKSKYGEIECRRRLADALEFVYDWMRRQSLKLNCSKTIFLPLSRNSDFINNCDPITVGGSIVNPSTEARNLGFIFDSGFTFDSQVSSVRKSSFYHLKRLQALKPFVPESCLPTLAHAFVTSRIDFCNSLYFGLPAHRLERLQSVLKATAKFLTGRKKYDSGSAALKELHWLSLKERISFKIATIAFHTYNQTMNYPLYFNQVEPHKSSCNMSTRSSLLPRLACSYRPRLKSCGHRSISYSAPTVFNSLPSDLRSVHAYETFKANLKTYLFTFY